MPIGSASSLTTYRDKRVTPIGRFLRWTKLDELPNLINVIKGEMSLIGPRPEAPDYVKYYTQAQKQVLQVKPGMTGPSQLANRDEEEKLKGQPRCRALLHNRVDAKKTCVGSPLCCDTEHRYRYGMVAKNLLGRHLCRHAAPNEGWQSAVGRMAKFSNPSSRGFR